jgi:thiol-disulfide isomerase/thioredoxin
MRLVAPIAVVLVALGAVYALTRGAQSASPAAVTTASGWALPRLLGDGQLRLSDFRGKPVVVDFFASWCTACRDELPELLRVSRAADGRVAFVGIDSEETGDGLAMARATGITAWPLARDAGGSQQSGLRDAVEGIAGMPVIAFYDAQGRLVASRLGAVTGATLAGLLRQYFGLNVTA